MASTILVLPQPPSWHGVWRVSWKLNDRTKTYRRADLDKVLADGLAVVHGVEGSDFVDAHGRHLEHAGDFVHDADAGPAELALAEVQQRHDGGLLVLRGVALEDLIDELEVLLGEFEGDAGIVVRAVAVLWARC